MMTNLFEVKVNEEHKIKKRSNNEYLNRAIHALIRGGFKTWEQVNRSKIEDLLKLKGLSKKGLNLIIEEMNDLGI